MDLIIGYFKLVVIKTKNGKSASVEITEKTMSGLFQRHTFEKNNLMRST